MEGFRELLKGRNRSCLMGFSMLWIIAFHFAMYGNLLRFPVVDLIAGRGYLGVDVFFFLSSYGLCYSLNKNSLKEYYRRRLNRIFPAYFLFLASLFLFFPSTRGDSFLLTSLYQITGVSMFLGIEIEWFIPALILIYLFFPILYVAVEYVYRKGSMPTSILIVCLSLISFPLSEFVLYLFAFRLTIIVLGIITYLAMRDNNKSFLLGVYLLTAFLGLLFLGVSVEHINVDVSGSFFIPLMLYGLGQLNFKASELKIVPFIGEHSLEIYLAQCLALNHFLPNNTIGFIWSSIISLGIILSASVFFYYCNSLFHNLNRNGN